MRKLFAIVLCLFTLNSQAQTVITGRVESRQRYIQGAVVKINGTDRRVVTGSSGTFMVAVPDSLTNGTLIASFAGYADEQRGFRTDTINVIRMLHETPVMVTRKNRPQVYMRTAHKQIKKELRKIR